MHYKLLPHLWYTISSTADCDVECSNGISIHLPANFQHFLFADMESIDVSGEATVTQNPPNFTPYSESRGEEWTADLRIGHAAADAVAAVCTLTLGDLAQGGSLTDSNGQGVELDAPHAYATGHVDIADATEAAALYFTAGEDEIEIDFPAAPQTEDHAEATPIADFAERTKFTMDAYLGDSNVGGWYPTEQQTPPATLAELASLMNQEWSGQRVLNASVSGEKIVLTALSQYHGQQVSIRREDYDGYVFPFEGDEIILSGGTNARTPQDVVDILNANEDCPAAAVLDEDEQGITLTAKEYGVDYELSEDGNLFSNPQGMSGAHGDYTIAELLEAISGEFTDITAAAGTAEGTITLTAGTAGKAANAITYTATGCFGSGTTRQGSTTRGKDAVEQTEYKIYLNGNEFTGGAPAAPVPEPLGTTTTLKHGHVYTLALEEDADLSALGVEPNATAELWIDYTAGSVTWPGDWAWTKNAAPSTLVQGRYFVRLFNDGNITISNLYLSYTNE